MNVIKWNGRGLLLLALLALLAAGAGTFNATADLFQCTGTSACPSSGNGGDDIINGDEANNTLNGGDGDDTLFGNDGKDTLNGEDGDDTIFGGDGVDTIDGGAGDDTIFGGPGRDDINGGDGNDKINVFPGDVPNGDPEIINCGAGNDTVNFIGFGPLTFNTSEVQSFSSDADGATTEIEFDVVDPITGGTYRVTLADDPGPPPTVNCERLNGLTTLPQ